MQAMVGKNIFIKEDIIWQWKLAEIFLTMQS